MQRVQQILMNFSTQRTAIYPTQTWTSNYVPLTTLPLPKLPALPAPTGTFAYLLLLNKCKSKSTLTVSPCLTKVVKSRVAAL